MTPLSPVPSRPSRARRSAAGDDGGAVLRLNRSLAEARSSVEQLQQHHWLDHRWDTRTETALKIESGRSSDLRLRW